MAVFVVEEGERELFRERVGLGRDANDRRAVEVIGKRELRVESWAAGEHAPVELPVAIVRKPD